MHEGKTSQWLFLECFWNDLRWDIFHGGKSCIGIHHDSFANGVQHQLSMEIAMNMKAGRRTTFLAQNVIFARQEKL